MHQQRSSDQRRGAVIWDLGNVLIRWDPRHLYRRHFTDDPAGMEWFLSEVCSPAWNEQLDAGLPFAKAIADLSARHPKHRTMIELYASHWPEMLGGAIDANVRLLHQLKAHGVPLYALTNWSAETYPVAAARFAFLKLFDGVVVSGVEGLIKPDPKIFQLLLDRYQLAPEHSYFIDDSPRNIAAARALKLKAIHFTEATTLSLDMFASITGLL